MSGLRIETDDAELHQIFEWATSTARRFVVADGVFGPLDVTEETATAPDRRVEYRASYHAGYLFRSGYYLRDFAHQAVGAQLLGLEAENAAMLDSFIRTATPEHGGWPVWSLNFDRVTPLAIDYHAPDRFVRELPAAFELIELVNVLYRWTGDQALLEHREHWRRTLTEFVTAHDRRRPNGVAEASGPGIFDGAASYNESPDGALLEAGDGIASQFAALRHAAALERALGEAGEAARFGTAANELRSMFEARWSRGTASPARGGVPATGWGDGLVSAWSFDGRPVREWLREATWFLPMKGLLADDDPRCAGVLDAVDAACRDAELAPRNIEALSYLPDLYLRHGRPDTAYSWIRAIHARRDEPHAVPLQGANGDYPELSFTLVAQIAAGFLGLEPDAAASRITTRPAPPSHVRRLAVRGIPFGGGSLAVGWAGDDEHWLENHTTHDVLWCPVTERDGRFHDPHLGRAPSTGYAVLVRPGERRAAPTRR